jgi:hypothetical protein
MFTSIFGIVAVLVEMSVKDRLERKKYIGVSRWESQLTARMMSRFPNTVTRYMNRNRLKMRGCSSGSSVSPRRRNSVIAVWFRGFIYLLNLIEKMG